MPQSTSGERYPEASQRQSPSPMPVDEHSRRHMEQPICGSPHKLAPDPGLHPVLPPAMRALLSPGRPATPVRPECRACSRSRRPAICGQVAESCPGSADQEILSYWQSSFPPTPKRASSHFDAGHKDRRGRPRASDLATPTIGTFPFLFTTCVSCPGKSPYDASIQQVERAVPAAKIPAD